MKILKYLGAVLLLQLIVIGCTKDFEEINTSPNAQTTGENAYLLTYAQIQTARSILDDYNTGYCKWVQYYTDNTEDNVAFANKTGNDVNDYWNYYSFYVDILANVEEIYKNCEKSPHPNYSAMASIIKAMSYGYLVDTWGDVPYSYAMHGNKSDSEETDFLFPLFDTGETIYKSIIELLMDANDQFDLSSDSKFPVIAASDPYANGDLMQWKKFCNTLTLRFLMRISDVDETYAKPLFEQIIADPVKYPLISSNDEDFGIVWITGVLAPWSNPIAKEHKDNGRTWAVSTGVLHHLATLNDPRLPVFVDPAKDYVDAGNPMYIGCPPAFDGENASGFTRIARDSISNISVATFADPDRKEPFITYSELQFILAEAALKNYNVPSSAKEYYEAGITASMDKYSVNLGSYLSDSGVDYDAATNKMEAIILQRYLAQFSQGANTFAMMRRTGYPALDFFKIFEDDVNGFPYRVRYPHKVIDSPGFKKSNAGEGIDAFMWGKKIWWATNAPAVQMFNTSIQTDIVEWPVN